MLDILYLPGCSWHVHGSSCDVLFDCAAAKQQLNNVAEPLWSRVWAMARSSYMADDGYVRMSHWGDRHTPSLEDELQVRVEGREAMVGRGRLREEKPPDTAQWSLRLVVYIDYLDIYIYHIHTYIYIYTYIPVYIYIYIYIYAYMCV